MKDHRRRFCQVISICLLTVSLAGSAWAQQSGSETDSLALVALYDSTDGNNWNDNSNWLTGPLHDWHGIGLDENGRVNSIDLNSNNLNGELPASFSDLIKVSEIFFYNNPELTGDIFGLIAGFDNLKRLRGHDCDFYGEIPPEIGNHTNFQDIAMWSNRLEGELPAEIGNLTSLTELRIEGNNFTGNIPSEVGNLSSLKRLNLNLNSFTGEIPATLGNLSNLIALSLFDNDLTGEIPPELGNLTELNDLELFKNELTGTIPTELGNLDSLRFFHLALNNLEGAVPAEIGNLSKLDGFDVSDNSLSGELPPELGNLQNLTYLNAFNNDLSGSIPAAFGNLNNLEALGLAGNNIDGVIPPELGGLTNLDNLNLGQNQLDGSIPIEIANLANLQRLRLRFNDLSGDIPPELGNLTNLTFLDLSNNQLSGQIPTSLGNLTNLTALFLNNNQISGAVPAEIGNLQELTHLGLGYSDLSGVLPEELSNLDKLHVFWPQQSDLVLPVSESFKAWFYNGGDVPRTPENRWWYVEGGDFRTTGSIDLPAVVPEAPVDEAMGQPIPALFSWHGHSIADRYKIEIYTDEALQDTVEIINQHPDSWFSAENLEYNTDYYWRVAGGVEYGLSTWSDTLHFKTMLDSDAGPALLTPGTDADSVNIPVQFSWEEFDGASTYYLEISTVASFDTTTTVKALSDTVFTFEEALDETGYFWRVRAEANGTPGGWSATGMFTTELRVPEVPEWSPQDGTEDVDTEIVLQWTPGKRAESYNLQLATDSAFGSLVADESGIDTTALAVSLNEETTYHWRIQAVNSSGTSGWSEPASFTTGTSTSVNDEETVPDQFNLSQNYPNPFNPSTQIRYDLPETAEVNLRVFDMLGREVAVLVDGERKSAGQYTAQFDASGLSSGMYLYRLEAGSFVKVHHMTLLK